ncbi:hypothetical protein KP509_23G073700 [Ceratopteris richardii]|uniref:Uncharacterized protein n=1 Tax=Ceratopteris richardii TaxID=49495 RepID=A0A8T2S467_CERRI|nr:hypothetical protein KP509_23G073700 [Ceratopteris richardii]
MDVLPSVSSSVFKNCRTATTHKCRYRAESASSFSDGCHHDETPIDVFTFRTQLRYFLSICPDATISIKISAPAIDRIEQEVHHCRRKPSGQSLSGTVVSVCAKSTTT